MQKNATLNNIFFKNIYFCTQIVRDNECISRDVLHQQVYKYTALILRILASQTFCFEYLDPFTKYKLS